MLIAKKLTADDKQEIEVVNHLYDMSFPHFEKRSHRGRQNILGNTHFHLYYFTDDQVFVGFVGGWQFEHFFYIEHFAIAPELRGKGYGQKVLRLLCQQTKDIILEIEPVIDDMTEKRLRFYQYCGFQKNNYHHFHPNYHLEYEPHQLEILSYPKQIDLMSFQQFNTVLAEIVMHPSLL